MKIISRLLLILCICSSSLAVGASEMTPHKFTDEEIKGGGAKYEIPCSSRFTAKRIGVNSPETLSIILASLKDKISPLLF